MRKKLLIFDLDGTLIDSVPDIATATNAMLVQLDYPPVSTDVVRNWVGNGSRKLIERALTHAINNHAITDTETNNISINNLASNTTNDGETYAREITDEAVDRAEAIFFDYYHQDTASKTQPYAGVDEGLRQLKDSGYTLALVTNKPARFVPSILQVFVWQDLFAIVLGGDSLNEKKPSPLPLKHVCQTLQIAADHAYMIGDSKNDILAGQHAGMDTLAVSYGYNYGQDIREFQPTHTFDGFADLVAFLL